MDRLSGMAYLRHAFEHAAFSGYYSTGFPTYVRPSRVRMHRDSWDMAELADGTLCDRSWGAGESGMVLYVRDICLGVRVMSKYSQFLDVFVFPGLRRYYVKA